MTTSLFDHLAPALLACLEIVQPTRGTPPAASAPDGSLHLFGLHIPALAAVALTVPIVWFACNLIHRSRQ